MLLLEESARLPYREWFVRLRFPGHEHSRIVNGLPEVWKWVTVGEYIDQGIVQLQIGPFGTQLRTSDYVENRIPIIHVRNIGYGNLRADKIEFVSESISERLGAHLFLAREIVFARKGAVDTY